MKIDQNVTVLQNGAAKAALLTPKGNPSDLAAATMSSSTADPLRLASSTVMLASHTGDFDAARVAEIRASISAGSYQVNTAKIADGLLSTVRDLLSKPTS